MDDAPRYAKNKLQAASRAKDESRRVTVGFKTAAAALILVLAIAMLDYWLMLPMAARLAGLAVLAGLILAGFFQLWNSLRRPTPLKEAALDAEAQKPELGCEISTAAEYLSGERQPTLEYEGAIVDALEEKAALNLRQLELPYWERPIRPAILLGMVALAMLVFGLLANGAWTAFRRAAAPWSNAAYTRVEVAPGNVEIPLGRDLDIKALFTGRAPKQAQFYWLQEGSLNWHEEPLAVNDQGESVHPLKNIRIGLKYRVSGNDAISPAYTVQPYVPPEVKAWSVNLAYPSYINRPPLLQESPEIAVVRGAKASFQIIPSVKLSKARFRFKDQSTLDLQPNQSGGWTGEFVVSTNTEYWIELADERGHAGGNEAPFSVKALPDAAPKVEIPEPGQDTRAEASTNVPVKVTVTDDFGIDEIRLLYHRLGDPAQVLTAKRHSETNTEYLAEIPLPSMGLKEYELVAYHAEARDNNTLDGPGIGKSDVYFIEITSEEGQSGKSQGKGQKVNLLVIQKQIIADTTALAADAALEKFDELAGRQEDAKEFGQVYLQELAASQAPAEAVEMMKTALQEMDQARERLVNRQRDGALTPEENALARLYGLLKMMPELKDLPTAPQVEQEQKKEEQSPLVQVVLEAIKKKKQEQPDNQEVEKALKEAQRLQSEQASLNLGIQNSSNGSAASESKLDRSGKKEATEGQGKAQEGKQENGNPGNQEGNGKPSDNQQLAELEKALSQQAAALAEKLARLAGKESKRGQGAAKKMSEAAGKMNAAAEAVGRGDMQTAGTKGMQGEASMESAIALLEKMVAKRPERTDVSREDFPKEYENAISEYFKTLSREE